VTRTCVTALSAFAPRSPLATYSCLACGVKRVLLRSGNQLIVPAAPALSPPPPPGDGGGRLARPLVRGPVRTDAAAIDGDALQVIPFKVARVNDDPIDLRRPPHLKLEQGPVRQAGLLQPRHGVNNHHRGTVRRRAVSHPSSCLRLARARGARRKRSSALLSTRGRPPRRAWRKAPAPGVAGEGAGC
jgi:hypothetical protein